ncbi:MAG TPA: DUF2079 domain-containing protein [Patescibacteria group bacterium]|nr:DUF2079 domain-containing protein [Patescibacteria group bacterium]
MKKHLFSLLKFLIGWPLSILALFFVIKIVAPQAPQFLSQLHTISLPLLGISMLCFFIYFFLRGYFWQRMTNHAGYNLSYKTINFIWAASELHRYIPGNIWSFVGRTVKLAEKGMSKKDIAKCTIYEMQFLVFGTAAASFLALPFVSLYFALPSWIPTFGIIGLFIGIILFAFHRKLGIKLFFLPDYHPFEMLFLIIITTLLFFFFGLGYYFTIISFIAIDPNLIWQITGVAILSYLIGYLSFITPSGIGVREGALAFGLAKIIPASAAGFVALFGRFTMTITEILYVFISYLWYHTKHHAIHRIETWIGQNKHIVLLLFLIAIYCAYFTTVTFLRFDNFYTGKYDLGNMSQTVWNTTQGRIFTLTNPDNAENASRLAIHADFILILLAPFYALWSDPKTLLFLQTIILAFGAIFVYLIGTHVLKNKHLALVFAFAFLINPSVERTNLYDFHAVTLATTFLLGAFYFFLNKRYKIFLFFAILAGLCKEEIWLIVALFGVFLVLQQKRYVFGSLLFVLCFSLFYFLIAYAIPNTLGANHFALSYFSAFGDSPLEIAQNILFHPQQIIATVFTGDRLMYLHYLSQPLGYLSVLAPHLLLFALPSLAINLLSSNPNLHQIHYQYTAAITPFVFIAAIYGVGFLLQRIKPIGALRYATNSIIFYLLTMSFSAAYFYGPLPGSKAANTDMLTRQEANKKEIAEALQTIPETAKVAASNNIASHLSNREHISVLPVGYEQADYVVLYFPQKPTWESTKKDIPFLEKLSKDNNYQATITKDFLVIFKKQSF